MGPIGVQEMIVIFLVALVLFGPKKLPELGKNLAKAMGEFRRAQSELKATFDREMQNIERETASLKEEAHKTSAEISSYTNMDLVGGSDGTYGSSQSNHAIGGAESASHPSTVGASEVSSAELHAEQLRASYAGIEHQAGEASLEVSQGFVDPPEPVSHIPNVVPGKETVARRTITAESNPLPELGEHGHKPSPDSSASSELPTLA